MKRILSLFMAVLMLAGLVPMTYAAEPEMLLHYDFESGASDVSGSGADGVLRGGVTVQDGYAVFDGVDGYIEMPEGILEGHDELTIAMNVCPKIYNKNQFTFNFGNSSTDGYLFMNTSRPDGKLYAAITPSDYNEEAAVSYDTGVEENKFASVIVVIDGNNMKLYRDAQLVSENDSLPITVSELGRTTQNWLGRSPYNDPYFSGAIADFRIYPTALSAERVRHLDDELNKDRDNYKLYLDINSISFDKAYRVTEDIELPAAGTESGAAIAWTSSDEGVISSSGEVTRPAADSEDTPVTLTANIALGDVSYTRDFEFTVLRNASVSEELRALLNSVELPEKASSLDMRTVLPEGVSYRYEGLSESSGVLTAAEPGVYEITLTAERDGVTVKRDCAVEFTDYELPAADKTVRVFPEQASPFGEFEGWGTSLCWWANYIGYSDKLTEKAAEYFFDPENGLGLNIVRYNIGGGDDPTHTHIEDGRPDGNMPGFAKLDADGNMYYDWNADENQVNVLKAAIEKGVDNIEAFANSAPYFMTISGCSSGGHDASQDNIAPEEYDDFAQYLCDVIKHFGEEGIEFDSISPFNEPDTSYWGYGSPKQEGMHVSPGEAQSGIVNALDSAIEENGIDIILAATEETDLTKAYENFEKLDDDAKAAVDRINAHTYSGSARTEVRQTAMEYGKSLWMSEVDGKFVDGENAGSMAPALGLGRRITIDLNGMQPTAWIIWQIIDSHKDNVFYTNTSLEFSDDGYWGTAIANHTNGEILRSKKYYGFGQYTRYIKEGMNLISSDDTGDTVTAYDNDEIVIVTTNRTGSEQTVTYDLTDFDGVLDAADVIRTTESENWAELGQVQVNGRTLTVTQPANSITTYVIHGQNIAPKANLPEYGVLEAELEDYGTYLKGEISGDISGTAVACFYDEGGMLVGTSTAEAEDGILPVKTSAVKFSEIRVFAGGKSYRAIGGN